MARKTVWALWNLFVGGVVCVSCLISMYLQEREKGGGDRRLGGTKNSLSMRSPSRIEHVRLVEAVGHNGPETHAEGVDGEE